MFSVMPGRREKRAGNGLAAPRESTPIDLLSREFPSLFNRAFAGWPISLEPTWEMAEPWRVTMEEEEEEGVVRVEVPGFEASELDLRLTGEVLTIRAEHKEKIDAEGAAPVKRGYRRLEFTVILPAGLVPEKIEARYYNGVLEIHVPKAPEARPRRIEVKT
jgi:HSP20 family protein